MLIVIPFISSDKEIYGIYAICISLLSFLQYTDIGFMDAGQKYAAESYGINDQKSEIRIFGFVHFIMFLFSLLFILGFVVLAFNPRMLIKNLQLEYFEISKYLLLILAFSSPIILIKRFVQAVFSIRIQDYISGQVDLITSIIKISSSFYFFRAGHKEIVQYFFFIQVMDFISVFVLLYFIKKLYSYDFKLLIKSFRFSKDIYYKTYKLAINSLFSTISWVLFFMLDTLIIAKFFGINDVAIYSISFYFFTTLNSILGMLYYPFLFRFNHFISKNDMNGLHDIFYRLIRIMIPFIIIPTFAIIFLMKPLILGWVGSDYTGSILISQILLTYFIGASINTPLTHLSMSKVKIKILYILSAIVPFAFYLTIALLHNQLGVLSLAVGKSIGISLSCIALVVYSSHLLPKSIFGFLAKLLPRILISIFILYFIIYLFDSTLTIPVSKNVLFLIKVVGGGFISAMSVLALYFFTNKSDRKLITSTLRILLIKK